MGTSATKPIAEGTADAAEESPLLSKTTNKSSFCYSDTDPEMVSDVSHDHSDHQHGLEKNLKNDPVLRKLKIATCLCCTFMLVEVVGGLLAGSLAVLSDAAHLMADLASFAVAIAAAYLSARPSTDKHTYGLKRTESLAALFSMTCLAMISIGLAVEALRRIYCMVYLPQIATEAVDGKLMSLIATIGVLVNVALAAVLGEHHVHMPGGSHGHDHSHSHDHNSHDGHDHSSHDGHDHDHDHTASNEEEDQNEAARNINLQAAYLHVMADLIQSVAVLIAGLIIWWRPHWKIVDPICTILFCILVFYSTLGVIRASITVLLEGVPPEVSWQKIYDAMTELPE